MPLLGNEVGEVRYLETNGSERNGRKLREIFVDKAACHVGTAAESHPVSFYSREKVVDLNKLHNFL